MSSLATGMKAFFTVSILLNIMLLGIGGGLAYQHYTHNPAEHIYREMSPEARNIVARTMQEAFREGRSTMDEARQIKNDLKVIISAEEFDEQKFMAEAQKMQAIKAAMGEKRIEVTRDLAKQLSQDDRTILAERFSKGFHGYKHKGKDKEHAHKQHDGAERSSERDISSAPAEVSLPNDMPPQPGQ